ncbi:MAG: hypothetical protein EA424_13580 [Planctomycetaceae bacterium]|nr:MAG: hypothetical protein EA424_13580 [Planctomycetaceae bacterium]
MAVSDESLRVTLDTNRAKLHGLTVDDARDAAGQGVPLIVVADLRRRFDGEADALLFQDDQHRIWNCRASRERLAAWLEDEMVTAICADQLPDVRLSGHAS